ncbi:MAG TPA: hypothetical protein VG900_16250 [Hyphomicrobiaceae bacterium]|nr:hypothetical protein [Hyphomicrobiaceae bacterium]
MSIAVDFDASGQTVDAMAIRDHMVGRINDTPLERDPFCHIYLENIFPPALYPRILANFPPREQYVPFNTRRYVRANGESTRDLLYLSREELSKAPPSVAAIWQPIVRALTDEKLKRAMFAKLAPDLAERLQIAESAVPEVHCGYDVMLLRDIEDYRIKPHPDGPSKYITFQFYLPESDANIDLGTSLYKSKKRLFGRSFEEVKRMPFKANSAYAFVVSDPRHVKSWHGREPLTGFKGVRNTLAVNFQKVTTRNYG